MQKRKAAVLYGPKDIRVEEVPMPTIGDDDVLVKVEAVGICGSDLHYYRDFQMGTDVITGPHILGHECSGRIVAIGRNVQERKIGDRVAIEPGVPCRRCEFCKEGRYNLCRSMVFRSHPMSEGAFVEYLVSPEDFAYPIPDNLTFEEGALIEPLAVGMHATKRGDVCAGDIAVILGSGPIGLSILQAAKARGAGKIFISDVNEFRLSRAKELGADVVIDVRSENVVQVVSELTSGRGADVVFETAGVTETFDASTKVAKRGGVIVFLAMWKNPMVPLNLYDMIDKELDFRGTFRYANVYPDAIQLQASGKTQMTELITHRYSIDQIAEAMEEALDPTNNLIKVIVNFPS